MIQLVCLNGAVFADHDADTDVPLAAYPAGCRVVPFAGSLASLPLLGDPPPPPRFTPDGMELPGEPDMRFQRAAPEVTSQADLIRYAASARYYRTLAGTTVSGRRYATDDATEAKIAGKWAAFQADKGLTVSWKAPDGFVSLDLAGFTSMAQAVASFREACFAAEAKADAGIRDGSVTTMDEVDALIAAAGA